MTPARRRPFCCNCRSSRRRNRTAPKRDYRARSHAGAHADPPEFRLLHVRCRVIEGSDRQRHEEQDHRPPRAMLQMVSATSPRPMAPPIADAIGPLTASMNATAAARVGGPDQGKQELDRPQLPHRPTFGGSSSNAVHCPAERAHIPTPTTTRRGGRRSARNRLTGIRPAAGSACAAYRPQMPDQADRRFVTPRRWCVALPEHTQEGDNHNEHGRRSDNTA